MTICSPVYSLLSSLPFFSFANVPPEISVPTILKSAVVVPVTFLLSSFGAVSYTHLGKYYYCFAADGTMLTGWHRIHNRFRYFGKQTGRMRINQTVNGRKINSKGVWTPVVVLDPGHSAVVADVYKRQQLQKELCFFCT